MTAQTTDSLPIRKFTEAFVRLFCFINFGQLALGCGLNAERWLSKHELVREVRASRGKWRAQAVIRQVRKAERGQRSKKWGEMSSIDRRRWLHYVSRWTHGEFTKAFLTHVWEPVYPDNDTKKVLVIVIRLPSTPMRAYWFWNVPVLHNSEHSASLHELMGTVKTCWHVVDMTSLSQRTWKSIERSRRSVRKWGGREKENKMAFCEWRPRLPRTHQFGKRKAVFY